MPKNKQTLLTRFKGMLGLSNAEGSDRGPFFGQGENGGWFELGNIEDGFQRNLEINNTDARHIPACYASVMAIARAVSQCYANVQERDKDGNVKIIQSGAVATLLKSPNAYETWPQFCLNLVAEMKFDGESFAVAVRNNRNEIISLHRCPRKTTSPYITADGSIFYSVGANPMTPDKQDYLIPQRDILHLRAHCPRHPLIGESDIKAAAIAAGINVALSKSQHAFFSRMSRPSGVLSTDIPLTEVQTNSLRASWEKQSTLMQSGGIPILGGGITFKQMGVSSVDSQLIEAQRLSIEDIARVYGVPLPIIGDLSHATLSNVEQLINMWLSLSLGSTLENIERSFDKLFGFTGNKFIELDTQALLRTDFEGRINGLTKAVQGGLFTPNEARSKEGLSPVPNGDDAYMQQQMVALGTQPAESIEPEVAPIPEVKPVDEIPLEEEKAVSKEDIQDLNNKNVDLMKRVLVDMKSNFAKENNELREIIKLNAQQKNDEIKSFIEQQTKQDEALTDEQSELIAKDAILKAMQ